MIFKIILLLVTANIVCGEESCYWNARCPFQLYSSKTPYDAIRGDIRDRSGIPNCEAVSIWSLNRHGNRNPDAKLAKKMKIVADLKDEIITSYIEGRSQLCAQDIENFRSWTWNETIEMSDSYLTGTGYEELYNIGKRIRENYPHLLNASEDMFYFRSTDEQRTITSSMAYIHGLTETTNLTLEVNSPLEQDDVIRPYKNCENYEKIVSGGQELNDQIEAYLSSDEYRTVHRNVRNRLGINTQLDNEDVYTLYELCRFYRSWTLTLVSPWCSVFSDEDLLVLEYRDDVRHYYKNGYGSWVNHRLGGLVLKDLYENMEAAIDGTGKNIISYFTHDTMVEMTMCAMGLYKDNFVIKGAKRMPNRMWRTSYISSFAANIVVVLNKCEGFDTEHFRVQIFINEKEIDICPHDGCTWREFKEKFSPFKDANMNFCTLGYKEPDQFSNSIVPGVSYPLLFALVLVVI